MLNSLYSGVSGLKGSQTKLDVIGNNIANVNTVGFKKGRVVFQDIMNKNIGGAVAPTGVRGGVNPMQIGLGSRIASVDTIHTPGSPMTTNVGTDLAIDGDAYFVVTPEYGGGTQYLTKAGNFTRDANGDLVNSNGYLVLGVYKDNLGNLFQAPINITDYNKPLTLADGYLDDGSGTGSVTDLSGNPTPYKVDGNGNIVDGNGDPVTKLVKFTSYSIDYNGYINVVDESGNSGKLAYDATNDKYYLNNSAVNQDDNISVGTSVVLNPGGLKKVGNTLFEVTANSGQPDFGRIEDNKGGQIISGVLEMSNVDLTEEFTEMIIAQRGFQANARTITTSDSILEEIVNLKR
ncbi:flagellar hook-basal body complex protein [Neobacillus sp. NPDC097160]|uniref:flagellar hook-basal body complex protein n=1 Tax=Neobacillus sp. NPDC097160 TaxID=3364298 RepID=UPI003820F8A1